MAVVQCPNCQVKLKLLKPNPVGTSMTCPRCSKPFSVGAIAVPPPLPGRPSPPPLPATVQAPLELPEEEPEQVGDSEPLDKPPTKIAYTAYKGRPPVNWILALACNFVSSSVSSFLVIPALTMENDGERATVRFILYLFAILGGALFTGVFTSAMGSRDRLWQPLYAGVVVGFLTGLWAVVGTAENRSASAGLLVLVFVVTFPVVILTVVLGGLLERSLLALERYLQPPRQWVYKTQDGKKITATAPAQYPIHVLFWSAMRWVFLLSFIPTLFLSSKDACRNIVPSIIMFVACRRLASKCRVRSAQDVLKSDRRPPIVYLRSFGDDGRSTGASGGGVLGRSFGGMMGALTSPPFEEILARTMRRYGPFVAIGRPGEEMADVGAARMYVGDDDWQTVVSDLLARPGSMALLQAGETAGLRWELQTAGEMLQPDQLLIFLPFAFEPSPKKREAQYAAFLSWARECLPEATFPEQFPKKTRFFYFRQGSWEVETLQEASKVPRSHPLADVLFDLQDNWGLLRHVRRTPPWLIASLLILGTVFVLVVLIALLVSAIKGTSQKTPNQSQPGIANPATVGPARMEYVGKAMPYRIRLDANWKEIPNPKDADREFDIPGGPNLTIITLDRNSDVEAFATRFVEGLGKKAQLLERKQIQHRGQEWVECRLKFTVNEGTGWMTVRFWSKDNWTVVLQTVFEQNDERTTRQATEALDAFELPSDVKAGPGPR